MRLELPRAADGTITVLPSGSTLAPRMREDLFLHGPEGTTCAPFVVNAPHASYALHGAYDCLSQPVRVVVWFSLNALVSVSLTPISSGQGWDDWSSLEEAKKKDDLERLLSSAYGNTRQFSWGTISANYDPRGGSSSIGVRYA